jgi:ABC-type transporter Mla maintaining outer membrane lipid asymmetry ATPase subunit MlaF
MSCTDTDTGGWMFEFLKRSKAPEKISVGPAPDGEIHIQIRGVHKSFDENHVLNGIDLNLHRGKINMIIGGSGSGKSVLLKHMLALITPDAGEIFVDGFNIVGKNDFELMLVRRKFGMLFQYSALFDSMTVMDNIAFPMREHTKLNEKEIREKVVGHLAQLKLESSIDKFPAELSGGMRKRALLARTLIYEPETLLMDEPFGALDAQLKLVMLDQLQALVRQRRMTCLFVTHDLGEAITLADRVVVLSARPGRIRAIRHIPLPRPRDVYKIRFTPEFAHHYEELWDVLKDEVGKGTDM